MPNNNQPDNTVSISVLEYRTLLERSAYLDIVLLMDKSFYQEKVCKVVRSILYLPEEESDKQTGEED